MNYVLGFAFTYEGEVALIRKAKPAWQAGKLNGVGGKIEDYDPSPVHAMTREFMEETGVIIGTNSWRHVGNVNFGGAHIGEPPGIVYVFTAEDPAVRYVRTTTIEPVRLYYKDELQDRSEQVLPNVLTLIEACLIRPNENGKRPFVELSYRS